MTFNINILWFNIYLGLEVVSYLLIKSSWLTAPASSWLKAYPCLTRNIRLETFFNYVQGAQINMISLLCFLVTKKEYFCGHPVLSILCIQLNVGLLFLSLLVFTKSLGHIVQQPEHGEIFQGKIFHTSNNLDDSDRILRRPPSRYTDSSFFLIWWNIVHRNNFLINWSHLCNTNFLRLIQEERIFYAFVREVQQECH